MTMLTSITVGFVFATSVYLLLSRELKAVAMGVFLLAHGAHLALLASSGSPLGKRPPVLGDGGVMLGYEADPLPQALILTAIVIGFAVQAFSLTMIVVTWRRTRTLEMSELAAPPAPVERVLASHDPHLRRLATTTPSELDPHFDPDQIDDEAAFDPDHPAYDRRQILVAHEEHEELRRDENNSAPPR